MILEQKPVAAAAGKGLALHYKVLIGFMLGTLLGLLVHFVAPGADWVQTIINYVARPFGTVFLNLLFMMVVTLIFSALVLGVAELGDVASLGRLGWRTLVYTAVVTGIAVLSGLVMANLFQPGTHMDPALVQQAMSTIQKISATLIDGVQRQDAEPMPRLSGEPAPEEIPLSEVWNATDHHCDPMSCRRSWPTS